MFIGWWLFCSSSDESGRQDVKILFLCLASGFLGTGITQNQPVVFQVTAALCTEIAPTAWTLSTTIPLSSTTFFGTNPNNSKSIQATFPGLTIPERNMKFRYSSPKYREFMRFLSFWCHMAIVTSGSCSFIDCLQDTTMLYQWQKGKGSGCLTSRTVCFFHLLKICWFATLTRLYFYRVSRRTVWSFNLGLPWLLGKIKKKTERKEPLTFFFKYFCIDKSEKKEKHKLFIHLVEKFV